MILTGENRSTGRGNCPSDTLSATNLTWTENCNKSTFYIRNQFLPHRKHCASNGKTYRRVLFKEIITVDGENHTIHKHAVAIKQSSLLNPVVHTVTTTI
jgi:hypothetical protein